MPIEFPSALSVSKFDGRKLLVIMAILAVGTNGRISDWHYC